MNINISKTNENSSNTPLWYNWGGLNMDCILGDFILLL